MKRKWIIRSLAEIYRHITIPYHPIATIRIPDSYIGAIFQSVLLQRRITFTRCSGISAAHTYPSPPPYWKMKEPGKEKVKLRNYSWPHPPEEFWEGSLASDYWSFEQYKTRLTNAEVFRMDFIFIILLHQLLGEGFWEVVGRELAQQGWVGGTPPSLPPPLPHQEILL